MDFTAHRALQITFQGYTIHLLYQQKVAVVERRIPFKSKCNLRDMYLHLKSLYGLGRICSAGCFMHFSFILLLLYFHLY